MKLPNLILAITSIREPNSIARHNKAVQCVATAGLIAMGIQVSLWEGASAQTVHYAGLILAGLIDLVGLANWNQRITGNEAPQETSSE